MRLTKTLGLLALLAAVASGAALTRDRWLPPLQAALAPAPSPAEAGEVDAHAGHDHKGQGEGSANSIVMSAKGLKNIGFDALVIEPTDYERTLDLPAIVVERPGRSQVHITAPLTGIVSRIFAVTGEAVDSGDTLFEIRLTHEELVTAQREFLQTVANLEVTEREIERLQGLSEGVIAGRRILEQQYEQQKLEATLRASEQAMLLHGLSEEQVAQIRQTGRLFRTVTVRAPDHTHADDACSGPHLFTVQRLGVSKGEQVTVGRDLAILSDHCELQVEGIAFEDDAPLIREVARSDRPVRAKLLRSGHSDAAVPRLEVLYVADQIDPVSRALKVYLQLPNQVANDKTRPSGKRFLEWRFKPGQRMQLKFPVETWENQLVLPKTAVVDEGAESYVYRQNGDAFERVAVHVRRRTADDVVVANDGALFRGDVVAAAGAYQLHLALKNRAGGGIDPHAGHNH